MLPFLLFDKRKDSLLSYKDVKYIVEDSIDNNIYRNNPRHNEMIEKWKIDNNKDYRQCDDAYQCLMLGQSCTHQLVVDMVLIRSENWFAMEDSYDDDSKDIESRHEE